MVEVQAMYESCVMACDCMMQELLLITEAVAMVGVKGGGKTIGVTPFECAKCPNWWKAQEAAMSNRYLRMQ